MPKCRQWLVMGSRVTDDFYFVSACLLFSKNIFLHNDAYIILKGKQTKKKNLLKEYQNNYPCREVDGVFSVKDFSYPFLGFVSSDVKIN